MKWIAIAGVAGLGFLFWQGGANASAPLDSISAGWTKTLADLHLGPCTGCGGGATASNPAVQSPAATKQPQIIRLGH